MRIAARQRPNMANALCKSFHNAFAILGRCYQALVRARRRDLWEEFRKEATSSDYNHLLATVCDYFVVDGVEVDVVNRWIEDSINGICVADEED